MRVKNWKEHQHFKDRNPPWIKVYRSIMDQRDIMMLSDRSFRVLVCLWLIASEDKDMGGKLPPIKDISWRLRMSEKDVVKQFEELKAFLIEDDNEMISCRYHVDDPETETEAEREAEREAEAADAATPPASHCKVYDAWNEMAEKAGVPKARQTTKRNKALKARLKEPAFRDSWETAITMIPDSDFLRGINDRGWAATMDWFLRPDSAVNVVEGKYNRHGKTSKQALIEKNMEAHNFDEL